MIVLTKGRNNIGSSRRRLDRLWERVGASIRRFRPILPVIWRRSWLP